MNLCRGGEIGNRNRLKIGRRKTWEFESPPRHLIKKQKLVVILGPTASGKSDLAVKLARKFNGEVVSADSRQVYKGLNIGTGKITKKEMQGVKHHLLDVANPRKQFTVSDFVNVTNETIVQIVTKNKLPIVCGGTGFYIDALLGDKHIPEVPPNPNLRKQLEKKSAPQLFKILQKLDPLRAQNIDAKNPRRLVRAIEICKAVGKVPSIKAQVKSYDVLKIGIKVEEKELKKRINKRIEKWFRQGLLKEVETLHKKGLSWKRMSEIGLEYRLVSLFLQNKISKPELIYRMQSETWQYAKRQMTWFKKDKSIVWITPKDKRLHQKIIRKFLR